MILEESCQTIVGRVLEECFDIMVGSVVLEELIDVILGKALDERVEITVQSLFWKEPRGNLSWNNCVICVFFEDAWKTLNFVV